MTEKAKQIIKNVPKLMSGTVVNFYDFSRIVEQLCEENEELKKRNKVEDGLPTKKNVFVLFRNKATTESVKPCNLDVELKDWVRLNGLTEWRYIH